MISGTITWGDIAVIVGLLIGGTANFYAVKGMVSATDYKVEELRRGRGLILEHFPPMVRRCFGYGSSHYRSDDNGK